MYNPGITEEQGSPRGEIAKGPGRDTSALGVTGPGGKNFLTICGFMIK